MGKKSIEQRATGTELQEIQDLRRKGVTATEWWQFILNSARHKKAWELHYLDGALTLAMWGFLLTPSRGSFLRKWEKAHQEEDTTTANWWDVVISYPDTMREKAVRVLRSTIYGLKKEVPELELLLLQILEDSNLKVRLVVIEILGKVGRPSTIPLLFQILYQGNENLDYLIDEEVNEAIIEIGTKEKEATSSLLVQALKENPIGKVRLLALQGLGCLDNDSSSDLAFPESVVRAIVQALQDNKVEVREKAAFLLGAFGKKIKEAVPALIKKALKDENANVRAGAAISLGEIGDKKAISALTRCLRDSDRAVREEAVFSLGMLGIKDVLPSLALALEDKCPIIQEETLSLIGGSQDKAVIPVLSKTVQSKSKELSEKAIWYLGEIGGKEAKRALTKALETAKESKQQENIRKALDKISK